MQRHEFLRHLHRVVAPRTYLEIGVSDGRSLTLAEVPSIGVDPALKVRTRLNRDVKLVRATSDEFFARPDPMGHFRADRRRVRDLFRSHPPRSHERGETTVDLVFIDGMHLFEFALRDFMNVESYAAWTSVIVFDDMLPRNVDEAARDRHTKFWAGDVFKVVEVLRRHRPELVILPVDTQPTGTLVVLGAIPGNRELGTAYDEIVRTWAVPDPQALPVAVLSRSDAADPQRVVEAGVWADLVRARDEGIDRATGYDRIRDQMMSLAPRPVGATT
jgi:hypothetical protein